MTSDPTLSPNRALLSDLDEWCDTEYPKWGEDFFPGALRELSELGLHRLLLDGADGVDLSRMVVAAETSERLAGTLPALAIATSVARLHTYLLAKYARPEIRELYVHRTATAEIFGGFAMTEPDAGTDVRGMSTVAEDRGDHFLLTGEKCWIGLAPVSDYVIVLAKRDSDARDAATVALVVDMSLEGAEGSAGPAVSGARGMPNGRLTFDRVRVDSIRELDCDGFSGMMDGLNLARIEAAAFSTGIIRRSLELSAARAESRRAFDGPLINLPSIQAKLGRMWTDYSAARRLTLDAARSFQDGRGGDRHLISMAKLFGSDASRRHTDEAMQVFGARGLDEAGEVFRLHNAAKVMQIFDGTSEIHETMLGRGAAKAFGRS